MGATYEDNKRHRFTKQIVGDRRATSPVGRSGRALRPGLLKMHKFEGFNRDNGAKKYLCIGGEIGAGGFVSCSKLPALYNVPSRECLFISDFHADQIETMPDGRLTGSPKLLGMDSRQFIVLRPDSTGAYQVPESGA